MHLTPFVVRSFILGAAALLAVWAAGSDARGFRIPNAACLGIALLFPFYALVANEPLEWSSHLLAGAGVLVGGLALYAKHYMGAGDVKFLAALALWAGGERLGVFLLMTAMIGGVLSVGLALKAVLTSRREHPGNHEAAAAALRTPVPYGLAIGTAGLCVFYLLSPLG